MYSSSCSLAMFVSVTASSSSFFASFISCSLSSNKTLRVHANSPNFVQYDSTHQHVDTVQIVSHLKFSMDSRSSSFEFSLSCNYGEFSLC